MPSPRSSAFEVFHYGARASAPRVVAATTASSVSARWWRSVIEHGAAAIPLRASTATLHQRRPRAAHRQCH
ncbi:hypothetical protein DSL92_02525 [Billgrantia gudaonensis]|uniref:Uncharacterized protein n=1 Tax=Billgrantia gudaonensis TaxID=376427 RepID=A0A3S0QG64_9GAMM|nr:hypothetical protein DSL92_02525 [Halomonas gudaonensis]